MIDVAHYSVFVDHGLLHLTYGADPDVVSIHVEQVQEMEEGVAVR